MSDHNEVPSLTMGIRILSDFLNRIDNGVIDRKNRYDNYTSITPPALKPDKPVETWDEFISAYKATHHQAGNFLTPDVMHGDIFPLYFTLTVHYFHNDDSGSVTVIVADNCHALIYTDTKDMLGFSCGRKHQYTISQGSQKLV